MVSHVIRTAPDVVRRGSGAPQLVGGAGSTVHRERSGVEEIRRTREAFGWRNDGFRKWRRVELTCSRGVHAGSRVVYTGSDQLPGAVLVFVVLEETRTK